MDLTQINVVKELMSSSKDEASWNENCDKVKRANNDYPSWWYPEIILSGLFAATRLKW